MYKYKNKVKQLGVDLSLIVPGVREEMQGAQSLVAISKEQPGKKRDWCRARMA